MTNLTFFFGSCFVGMINIWKFPFSRILAMKYRQRWSINDFVIFCVDHENSIKQFLYCFFFFNDRKFLKMFRKVRFIVESLEGNWTGLSRKLLFLHDVLSQLSSGSHITQIFFSFYFPWVVDSLVYGVYVGRRNASHPHETISSNYKLAAHGLDFLLALQPFFPAPDTNFLTVKTTVSLQRPSAS